MKITSMIFNILFTKDISSISTVKINITSKYMRAKNYIIMGIVCIKSKALLEWFYT